MIRETPNESLPNTKYKGKYIHNNKKTKLPLTNIFNIILSNIPPQTHDALKESIESLSIRKRKRLIECDLVNKSAICIEEETKGKVMVPC